MIKPEQVPHAAMNALLLALRQRRGGKEAIAAALSAWPGMSISPIPHWPGPHQEVVQVPSLILPLPPPPTGEQE